MKIILNYNPATGVVSDPNNDSFIVNWHGLEEHEAPSDSEEIGGSFVDTPKAEKYLRMGLSADDIAKLSDKNLL